MTDGAPDLIEPLTGFRSWWLKGGHLESLAWDEQWDEPVKHAVCRQGEDSDFTDPPPSHEAPGPDCDCGIYALHAPGVVSPEPGKVWGIVALWGQILVYGKGMRAQHACIKALAPADPAYSRAVRQIARRLGVNVVTVAELAEASARYGMTIPSELLPVVPKLQYRKLKVPPSFRFVYQSTGRLWVYPWGCGAEGLEEEVDLPGAVGDVFALDDDRAVAVFAYAGATRPRAAQALLAWAEEDDWRLGISPDEAPLARSTNRDWGEAWCSRCAEPMISKDDWKERMKMAGRGFTSTRHCWVCRGRLLWRR
jgi:hypothetical protein